MLPFFGGSFATTAVVVAMMIKTKDKKLKQLCIPASISGFFGVTEPAIYGILLPKKKPFMLSCIAAALVGGFYGLFNLREFAMGGLGIFGFTTLIDPVTNSFDNMYVGIIGAVAAMILGFVFTMLFWKDDTKEVVVEASVKPTELLNKEIILAPIKGVVLPLSKVEDCAFSQGILGKGLAIEPEKGEVVSPVNGTITTLFPTYHAIGITSDSGIEVLIHVGMDTVQLEGKYFHPCIKQGDQVHAGQTLLTFEMDQIKNAGYSLLTPVVITNTADYLDVMETGLENKEEFLTIIR